jgi:hypothetical protein
MAALFVGTATVVSLGSVAFASDSPQNPQLQSPHRSSAAAAAVPNSCLKIAQPAGSGGQHYRNVNNTPWTYTSATYGGNWFNVACGSTKFTVPRGQQALVSLGATAELDCNASTANVNGWCEGRYLVNGKPALPDNTGRGDTYAWDSTNGGSYNWSAHQLTQALVLSCPRSATTSAPCTYTAQLQARFQNNATSLWLDDLTSAVDVTVGKVVTTSAPATP